MATATEQANSEHLTNDSSIPEKQPIPPPSSDRPELQQNGTDRNGGDRPPRQPAEYNRPPSPPEPNKLIHSEGDPYHGQYRYAEDGFNPFAGQRGGYGGGKPLPGRPSPYPPQQQQPQRFMSGQSISQPSGPTPTLNQLLQSSSGGAPRYPPPHNNYPEQQYQWAAAHHQQQQRQQQPPMGYPGGYTRGPHPQAPSSRPYLAGPGGGPPPPSSVAPTGGSPQYPPYPQRYPTPPAGPGRPPQPGGPPQQGPYPSHQMSGYGPQGPLYDQRPSPQWQPPAPQSGGGAPTPPQQSPGASSPSAATAPPPSSTPAATAPSPAQQQQPSSFPSRPGQSATPNAHGPDGGDQNSNDSSSGHGAAPGTPNSQQGGLSSRPTPSPTGSTGSRSMSPAVQGQPNIPMPPRPSSGQSEVPAAPRMSHSPMANQGGYPPPPHMQQHPGYKMGGQPSGGGPMGYGPPQQYQQGNYSARPPMSYGPYPSGAQGAAPYRASGGPMPNHMPPQQPPGQFYPGWGPPGMAQQQGPVQGKGQSGSNAGGPRPHTPPNYLKQHLQQKMGFGSSPGGYPPGGMGPPMGPPMVISAPTASVPPPSMPNNHESPLNMPPPSSTPNSHPSQHQQPSQQEPPEATDNGITTTATGSSGTSVTSSMAGSVTSVITTGPDGAPLDDGSQQSTLSNASAASGEEQQLTPKSSRIKIGPPLESGPPGMLGPPADRGPYGHPGTPQSNVASPGAASVNSMHEDYGEVSSPGGGWRNTPTSPVYNSHPTPQDHYRPKKPDSLGKLYEMDDNPERRPWLDKLLQFMDERGTPINACPTISKNTLDLFRLYFFVKERAGFMEVTKAKTWKDVAGQLGIGASSSAAYTLRKHYTKHLLPFECHFDRGGIDPQPIISQVEASTKKKGPKASSVPSPGSSNSQDSFPPPGSGSASMDGYGYGYPSGNTPDYGSPPMQQQQQRPSSQSNPAAAASSSCNSSPVSISNPFDDRGAVGHPSSVRPHQGGYQGPAGFSPHYPPQSADQYGRPQPPEFGGPQQQQPYPGGQSYPPRPMYPPYQQEGERGYHPSQQGGPQQQQPPPSTPPGGAQADPYSRWPQGGPPPPPPSSGGPPSAPAPYPPPRPGGYGSNAQVAPPPTPQPGSPQQQQQQQQQSVAQPPPAPTVAATPPPPPPAGAGGVGYQQQDYYRPDQVPPPSQQAVSSVPPVVQKPLPPPPSSHFPPQQQQQQQRIPPPHPGMESPLKSASHPQHFQPPQQQQQYPGPGGSGPPSQIYPGSPVVGKPGAMPPPAPQPRRHPDFNKDQQQPPPPPPQQQQGYGPYPQQRPAMYAGWGNNSQFRGPYPGPTGGPPPQQWGPRPPGPPNSSGGQWDHHRYPAAGAPPGFQQPSQAQAGQWMPSPGQQVRPPMQRPFRPDAKGGYPMSPHMKGPGMSNHLPPGMVSQPLGPQFPHPSLGGKRDHLAFPQDSVEATVPVFYKRRRMARIDVAPVEAWRIMMSLRSGLLAESCWALDVLNVLLFDDSSVAYFGLGNLPGLLDTLLEHFRRSLSDMFDASPEEEEERIKSLIAKNKLSITEKKWYETPCASAPEVDLGCPRNINPNEHSIIFSSAVKNYTSVTRKGAPVTFVPRDTDPFVDDSKREWDETEPWDDPLALLLMAPPGTGTLAGAEAETGWPSVSGANGDSMKYIVPCFKAEFGTTPFVRLLPDKEPAPSPPPPTLQPAVTIKEEPVAIPERKNCEVVAKKKTKSKSLNDVLSRIKKEPVSQTTTEETVIPPPVLEPELPPVSPPPKPPPTPPPAPTVPETNGQLSDHEEEVDKPKLEVKDPAGSLRRKRLEDYEDESYTRDEASLCLLSDNHESVARRCLCVANILRSMTFIPGNETEFAKSTAFLSLLGKLIMLHHDHPVRATKQRNYDRDEDAAECADASCSSLAGDGEWWWEHLHVLRESVLVMTANISGHLDLGQHPEEISRPIFDGLLHWSVCPAAYGQDPFPTSSASMLSPQRLALEALCKLCVTDSNVDLLLATPPHSRLERLCATLARLLCRSEEQPLREFAVNLLHSLAAAASSAARVVAMQAPTVSLLLGFIEQAEQAALAVANQHGIQALRDNPDSMGTSLDMLRRAAGTLLHLSRHRANRPLFLQQEHRLLALVMSQILDQHVAAILSRVLYQCSRVESSVES